MMAKQMYSEKSSAAVYSQVRIEHTACPYLLNAPLASCMYGT
jgi:hypothetical protein